MNSFSSGLVRGLLAAAAMLLATRAGAGFGTSIPISAEQATSIARSLFPQALAVGEVKLFLSEPAVVYVDAKRIAVRMQVQAYDHRPAQGIALSEEGEATLSGELGYDAASGQILLFRPRLDELVFSADTAFTEQVRRSIDAGWQSQVTNPVRADIPPHPYLQPFRHGIQDVSYGKQGIVVQVWYD